jgi:hypothetical protein
MTRVLFTVDTELSPGFHQRGMSPQDNLNRNIFGIVPGGAWGVGYQIKRFDAHRFKAVFFVEALSSYAVGGDILKRAVAPILEAGHEVQLHLHTEWLQWTTKELADGKRGGNLANFDLTVQRRLLTLGLEALSQAGVPAVRAFRAGNYGVNLDSLRALAQIGIAFDTSYNRMFMGKPCALESLPTLNAPAEVEGVVEIPITHFEDLPGRVRHLQLCAVSAAEMEWAVATSIRQSRPTTVVVGHSFELLNRERTKANTFLLRRFDEFFATMEAHAAKSEVTTFGRLNPVECLSAAPEVKPMKSNAVRTVRRMAEQSMSSLVFDMQ